MKVRNRTGKFNRSLVTCSRPEWRLSRTPFCGPWCTCFTIQTLWSKCKKKSIGWWAKTKRPCSKTILIYPTRRPPWTKCYGSRVSHRWAQRTRLPGKFHSRLVATDLYFKTHTVSSSDVTLNGYYIPNGARIIPLQHFVHNDPNLWDEPEAFKPERFINSEGKVKRPDCFMPFGVGKKYLMNILFYDCIMCC